MVYPYQPFLLNDFENITIILPHFLDVFTIFYFYRLSFPISQLAKLFNQGFISYFWMK